MSDSQVRQFKRKVLDAVDETLSPTSIIFPNTETSEEKYQGCDQQWTEI